MRLRQRFLALVALLLIFVLGGSFYFIFRDLRREFLSNFEQDLKTSVVAFRSQEARRFRTLKVIAGFLESSPTFRTVLRRSDYQTVQEYLKDVNGDTEVNLIVLTDAQGKLLNRTDADGETGTDLSGRNPVAQAADGEVVEDYWLEANKLYQVVSLPLVDSQDFVDGTITLGFEIDQSFVEALKTDLGDEVAFVQGSWSLHTNSELLDSQNSNYLVETVKVGGTGTASANFLVGKSLQPMHDFVKSSQRNLLSLGIAALLFALLVSIPLIGKMTNPVLALEAAQAEMETIFTTNLDGLLATDENGLITTCNPAATIALGFESEELVGSAISDRLPAGVDQKLEELSGGTAQSASFTRQGRVFRVYRTYIKLDSTDLLGSIFLFHDITEEKATEHLFARFVDQLQAVTLSEHTPAEVKLAITNLQFWGMLKKDELEPKLTACSTDAGEVLADEEWLSICRQNLEAFARSTGVTDAKISAQKNGGSIDFQIEIIGTDYPETLGADPLHTKSGFQALGLFVASELLREMNSHLKLARSKKLLSFSLPRAVDVKSTVS